MRVAGASIPVGRDVAVNLEWIRRAARVAKNELHADLLLTPECALSGYESTWSEDDIRSAFHQVTEVARSLHIAIAVGAFMPTEDGTASANELRIISKAGECVGMYRKRLLVSSSPHVTAEPDEESLLIPGSAPFTLSIEGMRFGALICNDLWSNPLYTVGPFSDLVAELSANGVETILHAVNTGIDDTASGDWPDVHRHFHASNLRLRARANRVSILTVDVADAEGQTLASSTTGIVGPDGTWVARLQTPGPAVISAMIGADDHQIRIWRF